jgi:hypothetical protein
MRLAFILLAVSPVLLTVTGAGALSPVTGARLLHDCRAAIRSTDVSPRLTLDEDRAADHCISYVQGVLDANAFWHTIDDRDHNKMRHYCLDQDISTEQVIRLLVIYLQENPKEMSENGWMCMEAALMKSFQCKN